MVGSHHIVRRLASLVVLCSVAHESPGDGASAFATPATDAMGAATAKIAIAVADISRSLRMMDSSSAVTRRSEPPNANYDGIPERTSRQKIANRRAGGNRSR